MVVRYSTSGSPLISGTTVDWPGYWRESKESQEILRTIEKISTRNNGQKSGEEIVHPAYAAPFLVQVKELLKRCISRTDSLEPNTHSIFVTGMPSLTSETDLVRTSLRCPGLLDCRTNA